MERVNFFEHIKAIERDLVHQAMIASKGSRIIASEFLGVKRTTLVMILKRLGMINDYARTDPKDYRRPKKYRERE